MGFLILCVNPAISYQTAFMHKDCDEIKLWQVPFGWSWLQEFSTLIKMPLNNLVFTLSSLLQAKGSCSSISVALANSADCSCSRAQIKNNLGLRKACESAELWGSSLQQRNNEQYTGKKYLQNGHLFTVIDLTTIKMENVAPSEVRMTWRFLGYRLSFIHL